MEALYTPSYRNPNSFAYFRFKTGAITADSINSNTLTPGGSPVSINGKFGKGVRLNISSWYETSVAQFNMGSPWTLNVWARNANNALWSAKVGSYEYYAGYNSANVFLHMHYSNDTDSDEGTSLPVGFNPARWNMFTYQAKNVAADSLVQIYINARLVLSNTIVGRLPAAFEVPFYISKFHVEGKNGSYGDIDDLLYIREFSTAKEIKKLYQSVAGAAALNIL